jgi:hypothetical protein
MPATVDWFVVFLAYSMMPMLFPQSAGAETILFAIWRVGQIVLLLGVCVALAREFWRASRAAKASLVVWAFLTLVMCFAQRVTWWDAVVEYDRIILLALRHHGIWQGLIQAGDQYIFGYPPGASLSILWGSAFGLHCNQAQTLLLFIWTSSFTLRYLSGHRWYSYCLFGLLYYLVHEIGWHYIYFYNNIIYTVVWAQLILVPLLRVQVRWWEQVLTALLLVCFRTQFSLALVPIVSGAMIHLLLNGPRRRTIAISLAAVAVAFAFGKFWDARAGQAYERQKALLAAEATVTSAGQDPSAIELVYKEAPTPQAVNRVGVYREAIEWAWGITDFNYSWSLILMAALWIFALALGWRVTLAYLVPLLTPAAIIVGTGPFALVFPQYKSYDSSLIRLETILPFLAAGMVVALDAEFLRQNDPSYKLPFARHFARWAERWSESGLIRFEPRTVATLLAGLILFVLLVGFKIHGSSVGYWSVNIGSGVDAQPLRGYNLPDTAEEGTETPLVLSQVRRGFKSRNLALGGGRAGFFASGGRSYFALFHLEEVGFYLLDLERGFSFYWNGPRFALFFAGFLLLLLLTGHYWCSLLGAVWLTWSPFPVRYGGYGEMSAACLLVVFGAYALFSSRRRVIVGAVVGLGFTVMSLLIRLPVGSMTALLLPALAVLGVLFARQREQFLNDRSFRSRALGAGALWVAISLVAATWQLFPTLRLLAQRGPTLTRAWTWAELLPKDQGVASGFVALLPVVWLGLWIEGPSAKNLLQRVLAGIATFLVGLCGVAALFNMPWAFRLVPGMALAIIALIISHLTSPFSENEERRAVRIGVGALLAVAAIEAWVLSLVLPGSVVLEPTVWLLVAGLALLLRRQLLFAAAVAWLIFPSLDKRPIVEGLGGLTHLPIYEKTEAIAQADPNARWVVFGDFTYANLLKSAGAAVLNGTTLVPDPEVNRAIDGTGTNRLRLLESPHLQFLGTNAGVPQLVPRSDYPGTVTFDVNPCSGALDALKLNYVALVGRIADASMRCLEFVANENGIAIYKRH